MRSRKTPGPDTLVGIADAIRKAERRADKDGAEPTSEVLDTADILKAITLATRQREERLFETVKAEPHNQPFGHAVLFGILVAAVAGVLTMFCWASYESFDVFAKVVVLASGLFGSVVVLLEDPFHENLPTQATFLERLKLQGKLVVITSLTAVVCTGLNFYTDHAEHNREQKELANKIDDAAQTTLATLGDAQKATEDLRKKLAALDQRVDSSVITTLNTISTNTTAIADLPKRHELMLRGELNTQLRAVTTNADQVAKSLATAKSIDALSTTVGTLATAKSVSDLTTGGTLATSKAVSDLATTVGTLATSKSLDTLATNVSTLATTVDTLATAKSLNEVVKGIGGLATSSAMDALAKSVQPVAKYVGEQEHRNTSTGSGAGSGGG